MADTLLLRKGSYAHLMDNIKCPIMPGAISITTDEPGIYIDLAADATHSSDYRLRIGDFIRFNTLADLLDKGLDETEGKRFSSNALYYAEDKNVLCVYDEGEGKFIWVNSTEAIDTRIDGIDTTIASIQSAITSINNTLTAINNTIGSRTLNHLGTHTKNSNGTYTEKTIFKSIEDEYTRAIAAEIALSTEIEAIKGGEGDSLSQLRADLTAEAATREAADTALGNDITNLQAKDAELAGDIGDLETLIGDTNDTKDDNTVFGKIAAEAARATAAESTLTTNLSNLTKDVDNYKTTTNNAISALQAADEGILTRLGTAESNIQTVAGNLSTETNNRISADNALGGRIDNLTSTVASNKTTLENSISNLTNKHNKDLNVLRGEFTAADDELITELRNYINDNFAVADSMTFKGGVAFISGTSILDLPKTGVQKGDTYVVVSDGGEGAAHTYHAGDLMIANSDQAISLRIKDEYEGSEVKENIIPTQTYRIAQGKSVTIYYMERIDWFHQYNDWKEDPRDGVDTTIAGCGYDEDRYGYTVPVLFTAALQQSDRDDQWEMNYKNQYFYVGKDTVDGVEYDKWRRVENGRWADGLQYAYTNVIVEEVIETEYPASGWTRVQTGYDQRHEATLDLDTALGNPNITLKSHIGDVLSNISLKSTSSNLQVTNTMNGSYEAIGFSLQWAEF
jgi:hypothetical protein